MRSIKKDLSICVFILTSALGCLIGTGHYYYNISATQKFLTKESRIEFEELRNVLAPLLWSYDERTINYICNTEIKRKFINAIKVSNDLNMGICSGGESLSNDLIITDKVNFENRAIGTLEVAFDISFKSEDKEHLIVNSLIIVACISITSIIFIQFLLAKLLLSPLNTLERNIQLLTKKNYDQLDFG